MFLHLLSTCEAATGATSVPLPPRPGIQALSSVLRSALPGHRLNWRGLVGSLITSAVFFSSTTTRPDSSVDTQMQRHGSFYVLPEDIWVYLYVPFFRRQQYLFDVAMQRCAAVLMDAQFRARFAGAGQVADELSQGQRHVAVAGMTKGEIRKPPVTRCEVIGGAGDVFIVIVQACRSWGQRV